METQKGPYKDYSPFKGSFLGFHVSLGECSVLDVLRRVKRESWFRPLGEQRELISQYVHNGCIAHRDIVASMPTETCYISPTLASTTSQLILNL